MRVTPTANVTVLRFGTDGEFVAPPPVPERRIEIIGDRWAGGGGGNGQFSWKTTWSECAGWMSGSCVT
jgi:hypothetical protein